jgi:hypothetical protein
MTDMGNTMMTLAEFERLLDVYGGDRTLWPADARAAAAQLVARAGRARQLLAEAEALDRVLERAPLPSLTVEAALADRIVAAARRSPRIVSIGPSEQRAVPAPTAEDAPRPALHAAGGRARPWRADVRAAVLLAASLVAGVVIGVSNLPHHILPGLAGVSDAEADRYDLARAVPFDEDVL